MDDGDDDDDDGDEEEEEEDGDDGDGDDDDMMVMVMGDGWWVMGDGWGWGGWWCRILMVIAMMHASAKRISSPSWETQYFQTFLHSNDGIHMGRYLMLTNKYKWE